MDTSRSVATRTLLLGGCLVVGDDVGGNQAADIECPDEIDSYDILERLQCLGFAAPGHHLHPQTNSGEQSDIPIVNTGRGHLLLKTAKCYLLDHADTCTVDHA